MSEGLLALLASLPIVAIFILMVGFRWPATKAMPFAFVITVLLAFLVWKTPLIWVLASSFNSLLAKSFAIPKRQIVMIKMNERVAQDDLLNGLEIAKITGVDIRKFLRLHKENNTWEKIISGLSQQETIKKAPRFEVIKAGMRVEEAGIRIVDEIIGELYKIKPEEINKLRMSGLNEKEMNLIFILAHAREQNPEVLVEQYKKQGRSWSEIAHNLGVAADATGKLIIAYPDRQIPE